jgi:hypothetical protein
MTQQIAIATAPKPGMNRWAEGAVLALSCSLGTLAIFTIAWLIFKHFGWNQWAILGNLAFGCVIGSVIGLAASAATR